MCVMLLLKFTVGTGLRNMKERGVHHPTGDMCVERTDFSQSGRVGVQPLASKPYFHTVGVGARR